MLLGLGRGREAELEADQDRRGRCDASEFHPFSPSPKKYDSHFLFLAGGGNDFQAKHRARPLGYFPSGRSRSPRDESLLAEPIILVVSGNTSEKV
jgi:hypothetical protein